MWVALLTNKINNKFEKSNLINEHVLNREHVPLKDDSWKWNFLKSLHQHCFQKPFSDKEREAERKHSAQLPQRVETDWH